jgi:hypothetical protein
VRLSKLRTAFDIAALVVLAPLVIVFVLLPCAAYLAILEWQGKIKEPRDPLHDEWERWEAQRGDFRAK